MEWLISLALLVAVASWVVATYQRLQHLHTKVREAWQQWESSTRQRNACLGAFAPALELCVSPTLPLTRELRHAVEDSELGLEQPGQHAAEAPGSLPDGEYLAPLGERERTLRHLVGDSLRVMDELAAPAQDEELHLLVSRLSASLFQQEQQTQLYNRAVADYNKALGSPSGKLVASAFRLPPAKALSTW